ncbi:MAG: hypothetical protein IKH28_00720 [Lachnospiraceae bacterium]|nr:hypothetical protein [Lachnospiraceae bacterium]
MLTSGQKINYDKYRNSLMSMPAPILGNQLPDAHIDFAGMLRYAREKGVKVGDLSEEEKNRFITGDTVESLQKKVKDSIKHKSLMEWNASRE